MRVLNFEFRKIKKPETSDDSLQLNFVAEFIKKDLSSYEVLASISKMVADKLANELYPEIKNELIGNKGMEKIINEVRLNLAKEIIK